MFSVIIPVYNKAPHLSRSIGSVLNQSFKDFELILIDDQSTDGSRELLQTFDDPRISVYYRDTPGPGGYAARNLGIAKAKFPWISFLDADDNWSIDYLLTLKKTIGLFPEIEVFSTAWEVAGANGKKVCPVSNMYPKDGFERISLNEFLRKSLINAPFIWTSAVTVRKSLLTKVGGFPEGKCKSGGDIDTWLRLLLEKKQMVFINTVLATYQTESVNMVTKSQKSFEIGCTMHTVREQLNKSSNKELIFLLKKYSNKYLFAIIAKSILSGKFDPSYVNWIYKESDPIKYVVASLMKLKPFRFLYKKYLVKRNPFYG